MAKTIVETVPPATLSRGLTHYKFEQSLVDSWGDNDASDNTSEGYSSTTVKRGSYAKKFDGTDDDIDTTISEIGNSNNGEYSIAFWLYFTGSTSSLERFLGNYNNTGDDIWIGNNGSDDLRFQDDVAGTAIKSGELVTDTWMHLVMAVDSNGVEGYKNGSSVATSGTGRSSPSSTGQTLLIGEEGNSNHTSMFVDNFKYYDRRLNDSEVSDLYNNSSTGSGSTPTNGVSRYEFEQDVTDSWGSNDGTDNTSAGYVSGKVGSYAKDFDGTDDYVQVNGLDTEIVAPVSVAVWVKRNSGTGSEQFVFSHGNPRFSIAFEERASDGWECNIFDGTHETITSGNTTSDAWVHLVSATDGSTMEFYIDGSSVGTKSLQSIDSGVEKTAFGAQSASKNDYFDGAIDDARVYNKRLSSTEVSNLYNNSSIGSGGIPNSGDLHARYDFSQYSGTSSFDDLTGNGYDLTNGSITGVGESINGKQAGEFDGTDDDLYTNTFSSSVSTPFTLFFVLRLDNPANNNWYTVAETDSDNQQLAYRDDNSNWFWNSDPGGLSGGSASANILSVRVSDPNNTKLRADGNVIGDKDNGENPMSILRIGSRNSTRWYFQGAIGEVLAYTNDQSSSFSAIETYLANKWGISI